MKQIYIIFYVVILLGMGCKSPPVESQTNLTILSYNVQTLFDAAFDGEEYEEYNPTESGWDNEKYQLRLRRLAQVLTRSTASAPDIILLQEIEHVQVLEDLWKGYLAREGYEFYLASNTPTATEVGIISRIVPTVARTHQIDIEGSLVRPILETHFSFNHGEIAVFNNHWKSKIPSSAESEPLRIAMAEALVVQMERVVVESPDCAIVVAGDFNEGYNENLLVPHDTALSVGSGGIIELYNPKQQVLSGTNPRQMYSPWFLSDALGSYVYQGDWETIDQFMLSPSLYDGVGLEYKDFSVVAPDFLVTQSGVPKKWNIATLQGYSDHLPILLELNWVD